MPLRESFPIGGVRMRAGTTRELSLPITRMVTGAEVSVPVRIVHGREDGPVVWLTAATHGDEVVGIEVIREVLTSLSPKTFRGTLVAVPIEEEVKFRGLCEGRGFPVLRIGVTDLPGASASIEVQDRFTLPVSELRTASHSTLPERFGEIIEPELFASLPNAAAARFERSMGMGISE